MRSRLTDGHEDIIYSDYLQSFQSTTDEIKSLRTKVSIILGFFGVALSILIANIVTKSYSINNLIPLISQITGLSPSQEDISYQLLVTPIKDGIFDGILLPLLVILLIIIAIDYFMLFTNIHQIPNMVFPTKEQLRECDDITSNILRKKKLLTHLKTAVENIDCDYKFYIRYLDELNQSLFLYFLICFVVLLLYVSINSLTIRAFNDWQSYLLLFCSLGMTGGSILMQCLIFSTLLSHSSNTAIRKRIVENQDWIYQKIILFSISTPLVIFTYIGLSYTSIMYLHTIIPYEVLLSIIGLGLGGLLIGVYLLYNKFYKSVRDLLRQTK